MIEYNRRWLNQILSKGVFVMDYDVIIIGAGASGLMLAASLDLSGPRKGLILEKTSRPGTKLLMSGGGRCNITHGGSIKDFVNAYGSAGQKLRKCLYRHNNISLAEWLEDNGISLSDEHGDPVYSYDLENAGRIFPASMKASDILSLLMEKAAHNGWEIRTESGVYDIRRNEGSSGWIVNASPAESFTAENIVIASGGITYPETGSDGSMFDILKYIGISVTPLHSALAPISVEDYPYEDLSGISIEDVTVTILGPDSSGKNTLKAAAMTGDLLFTHRGFSGPAILNISRYAKTGHTIRINYNKTADELPRRLIRSLEDRAKGPSGDIRTTILSALLSSDEFTISSVDEHGMVTAGGISLDQIDTHTMKLQAGENAGSGALYAIGEAIDADGITGGYNLQMCWSTANTAADSLRDSFCQSPE